MEAKLRIIGGAKPVALRLKLPTVIGRSGTATLTIKSSQISRRHCEIDAYEGELIVRDLGSSNGTYVNGERISDVTYLSPGDQLRIGPLTMIAEYEISTVTETEPPPKTGDSKTDASGQIESAPASTPVVSQPADSSSAPTDGMLANQVVGDRPADPSGVSSVVHYQENADGSFLGIEELVQAETESDASVDAPNESAGTPNNDCIDLGMEKENKVDPGDSQLNKFFEGLS